MQMCKTRLLQEDQPSEVQADAFGVIVEVFVLSGDGDKSYHCLSARASPLKSSKKGNAKTRVVNRIKWIFVEVTL